MAHLWKHMLTSGYTQQYHGFFVVKLFYGQRKNGLQISDVDDNSRETLLERIFSLTEFQDVCKVCFSRWHALCLGMDMFILKKNCDTDFVIQMSHQGQN